MLAWFLTNPTLIAILAGILALLGRLGLLLAERWRAWKQRRDRARREAEALQAVEKIVPVFIPPDELGPAVRISRDDVGGMVWDTWKRAPIGGAEVDVVCGDDRRSGEAPHVPLHAGQDRRLVAVLGLAHLADRQLGAGRHTLVLAAGLRAAAGDDGGHVRAVPVAVLLVG